MGIEGDEDFAVFFDPAAFGATAIYAGGKPATSRALPGIYQNAHTATAGADGWPGVSTVAPVYTCRASLLPPGAGDGDTLTLDGSIWAVRDIQPDGTGLARLILERT